MVCLWWALVGRGVGGVRLGRGWGGKIELLAAKGKNQSLYI